MLSIRDQYLATQKAKSETVRASTRSGPHRDIWISVDAVWKCLEHVKTHGLDELWASAAWLR